MQYSYNDRISTAIDSPSPRKGIVEPQDKEVRPVTMVAKVIVGFTCPPEPGPAAMMNSVRRKMFETPVNAAPCPVLKFVIVTSIRPER